MFTALWVVIIIAGGGLVAFIRLAPEKAAKVHLAPKSNKSADVYQEQPKKRRTRNERLPYRHVEDAPFLFISGTGVWTGVRLAGKTDEFNTNEEHELSVEAASAMYKDLLDLFVARGEKGKAEVPCHEIIRNQPIDTTDWKHRYRAQQWDPSEHFATLLDEKVEPHIRHASPVRVRYLMVRIGDQKNRTSIDPISRIVDMADGVADELFTVEELTVFRARAREVITRLSKYSYEITRGDLAWLIQESLSGMFPVPMGRDYLRTRYARGSWFDEFAQLDAENLKRQAAVRISNPDPHSSLPEACFVSTLVVQSSDPVVGFQYHSAWASVLRSLPNPPAISWRYKLISEKLWTDMIKKATSKIAQEAKERVKDGNEAAVDDTKFGALAAQADDAKRRNDLHPQPGMVGQLRIAISAWTLTELRQREQEVVDVMKHFVKVDRPKNIQQALLEEQLPGDFQPVNIGRAVLARDFAVGGGVDVGTRYTDIDVLAMARMDSAPTVGDDMATDHDGASIGWHGHVIGYASQNGAIVHFDPFVQIARNGGAGTAVIGASGGGKSSLSLSMFYWMSESGVQTVVLDPKNDFESFCLYIAFGPQVLDDGFRAEVNAGRAGTRGSKFQPVNAQFWADTRIVSLTNGNNGSLGAWSLTDDYETGETLARRQVAHLFSNLQPDDPRHGVIEEAFDTLRENYLRAAQEDPQHPLPTLDDLAGCVGEQVELYDGLRQSQGQEVAAVDAYNRVRGVQTFLRRAMRQDYARLLFGDVDKDGEAIRGFTHRRTVITMIGFTPPTTAEESRETEENRAAAAALYTVLWQVNEVFRNSGATVSPNRRRKDIRPRALIVDEAYMITAFDSGKDLLKRSLRQGRSLNFAVIIISQQAHDINEIERADSSKEDEADQNQFGTVFVFAQKGISEATSALALLRSGAAINTEEKQALSSLLLPASKGGFLATGVCVMKDYDNRVATVHVDMLFAELRRAAETNPMLKTSAHGTPISGDAAEWVVRTELRDRMMTKLAEERIADAVDEVEAQMFEFEEAQVLLASTSGVNQT
jgi:hypothetical protein